jgi:TolB-like protein
VRALRSFAVALLLSGIAAVQVDARQTGAPRAVRIAVVGLNAASIGGGHDHAAIAENLTSMMMSELGNRGAIELIERHRVADLLEQRYASATGQIDDRAAIEIGSMLGADYIVRGGVTFAGQDARFDLRIMHVETGQIHRTFKQTGRQRDFLAIVESVGNQFLTDLRLPERVAEVVVPPAAVLAYSRGLDFERRGERQRAAAMFQRALELFPAHPTASAALTRVR